VLRGGLGGGGGGGVSPEIVSRGNVASSTMYNFCDIVLIISCRYQ